MRAELLMRERLILSRRALVDIVIWKVPQPVRASAHSYKYSLAYIANQRCVLRFDNEAGKGDHKHEDEIEMPYQFTDLDVLQADFWAEVKKRRRGK